jgi:hypothetical protein
MTNNMKISLIKFKLAHYYQLSLWILTHVSYVKKTFKRDRKLHKMESCDRVKKIAKWFVIRIFSWIRQIMLNFKHSTISFTRIRSITRWMINNLHIGRIYVFEASQFLNHFLKNGIFAWEFYTNFVYILNLLICVLHILYWLLVFDNQVY